MRTTRSLHQRPSPRPYRPSVSPPASLHARLGLAACLLVGVSACFDTSGYTVLGRNESDRDVIVAVTGSNPGSVRLPARTWGRLFISFAAPEGELTVFDGSCGELVSIPFTETDVTVRIRPDGDVELMGNRWIAPEGVRREEAEFPEEHCG